MEKVSHYLTSQQIKALKELSQKTGLNASELLRRAVDEYLERASHKGDTHVQHNHG